MQDPKPGSVENSLHFFKKIYNYIVFIIRPAGIGRSVTFVNRNQRNIRLTFIKEEKS